MECNKDEALRAKEIAEKKFLAGDVLGSKKFALKAQNLYPGLEGINQMLATLDVYIASENKLNGEANFYGILGVSPRADDESIRKQYRKLALMLHPDKNKSIGAEGAFKHVSEAWSLLSDKNKKSAYDHRNANVFQQRAQQSKVNSSQQSKQNGFHNLAKSAASQTRVPKGNATKTSSSSRKQEHTFWTVCYRCKMQYEYMRMYLNHNLLCPNCHEAFFAIETTPPANGSKKSTQWDNSHQQKSCHQGSKKTVPTTGRNRSDTSVFNNTDSSDHSNVQWSPFSKTANLANPASATQAANVVQQAYQKVKRERQEAQAATKREEALRRKNNPLKRPSGIPSAGHSNASKKKKGIDDPNTSKVKNRLETDRVNTASPTELGRGNCERSKMDITINFSGKEVSHNNVKHMLMEKARKEIRNKLTEWSSATVTPSMASREVNLTMKVKERKTEGDKGVVFDVRDDHNTVCEQVTTENKVSANRSSYKAFDNYLDNDPVESMSIDVPDSDFHNFDSDRIESCFGHNQVWAAYDDSDGMPRYYAMILKVISLNPFKARISWLNSNINSETGSPDCGNSGVPRTCGYFRIGRQKMSTSVNCFSHQVSWTKGPCGAIQIFPRKGEVWALYRNWSPEWDALTEDGVTQKYDLIEVLEDYHEEEGVLVIPLIKVAGFRTVFHRHLNPREIKRIQREEMFRFSHQVPSYLLKGQEGPNAPKGCRELDPAAMPAGLLEIIQDREIEHLDYEGSKEDTIGGPGTIISSNLREETPRTMEVIVVDS